MRAASDGGDGHDAHAARPLLPPVAASERVDDRARVHRCAAGRDESDHHRARTSRAPGGSSRSTRPRRRAAGRRARAGSPRPRTAAPGRGDARAAAGSRRGRPAPAGSGSSVASCTANSTPAGASSAASSRNAADVSSPIVRAAPRHLGDEPGASRPGPHPRSSATRGRPRRRLRSGTRATVPSKTCGDEPEPLGRERRVAERVLGTATAAAHPLRSSRCDARRRFAAAPGSTARAPEGTPRCGRRRRPRRRRESAWPIGTSIPRSITASAFGSPPSGWRNGTPRIIGWRVALPVHTVRVSMPRCSRNCWRSLRPKPASGWTRNTYDSHAVSSPASWRGGDELVGVAREELVVEREVALPARVVDRQLVELAEPERGAELGRLEVPRRRRRR